MNKWTTTDVWATLQNVKNSIKDNNNAIYKEKKN